MVTPLLSRSALTRSPATPATAAPLPRARGPLTDHLFRALTRPVHTVAPLTWSSADPLNDEDLQLALYCCYELHYRGLAGVDERWEWEPSLVALTRRLEALYEEAVRASLPPMATSASTIGADLWSLTEDGGGVSLSGWLRDFGTYEHARELAIHKSAYQLKEADPHSWAIPRLAGRAKAALITIQADEYGNGNVERMHASLFADAMTALGLETTYGHYLDQLPAQTLATTNLITMFGLHRRLRGALVGHLALFEMTSVGPMGRYAQWLASLGVPATGRDFYDVHVEADVVHQQIAVDDLVGGLLETEPDLAAEVLFGARAVSLVESRFTERLLRRWTRDTTSLL